MEICPPDQSRSFEPIWIVAIPCIGGAAGRTLTERVMLDPALTTSLSLGSPVTENGGAGIIGVPLKTRSALPLLVTVTVVLLLWLMNTLPKSTIGGFKTALGPAALPLSETVSMWPMLRSVV